MDIDQLFHHYRVLRVLASDAMTRDMPVLALIYVKAIVRVGEEIKAMAEKEIGGRDVRS